MQRRDFIAAAGMAGLLGIAGTAGRAEGKLRVALAWINNVEYAGLWVGLDKGYFKEEGLELKTLPGGPPMRAPTSWP